MPVSPTYPGVYIEEVSSGVRTITGVATSITAFVGWAPKGPTDRAQRVTSWTDFERDFGGLHAKSLMTYGVSHFFTNGGTDAYVVRVVGDGAKKAEAGVGDLQVTAKNEGAWGNDYGVAIRPRSDDVSRFRVSVVRFGEVPQGQTTPVTEEVEAFSNLSMDPDDPRWVEEVISTRSKIIDV